MATEIFSEKNETRWAPIWTDKETFDAVAKQTSSMLQKIRDSGTLKLSFPYFEYEYHPTPEKMYFQKEVDLAEHLTIESMASIFNQIGKAKPFRPFVAQIEETLVFALDLPEYYRFILNYLVRIPEIRNDHKDEIRTLASLPREILQDKILKSGDTPSPFPFALVDKYVKPVLPLYPRLGTTITELAVKEKTAVINSFRGEDYFVYPISVKGKPSDFSVYFPVSAKNSLPNIGEFRARVIGIVSYNPNLPLGAKTGQPFFARAVSLFLPYVVHSST